MPVVSHIDPKKVFRTARPYIPIIINPSMTKDVMWVSKNHPWNVYEEIHDHPDLYDRFEATASDFIEGYEPRKAFLNDENSDGWMADITVPEDGGFGNETNPWICMDAGSWDYRSLAINTDNWHFPVTKVEIINHSNRKNICKTFELQILRNGTWVKLRTCKIIKDDPYPIELEQLPAPSEEWTNYIVKYGYYFYECIKDGSGYRWEFIWRNHQIVTRKEQLKYRSVFEVERPDDYNWTYYKKIRLVVKSSIGSERTGFKCIKIYTFRDHDEITYGYDNIKNRLWPHFWEKIFIKNDDCDGVVWEKMHDSTMLFAVTSWYPGFYSSTNYHVGVIHPNDTIKAKRPGDEIYRDVSNGPFVLGADSWFLYPGEYICRTKDYIVCRVGNYYSDSNTIRYSANGKEWTKWFSVPVGFWRGAAGGFGLKDNTGMCFSGDKVYSLELADWDVKITQIGKIGEGGIVDNGGYVGDIAMQGTALGEHGLQYHKFLNTDGELYTSKLQAEYQYIDMREPDPVKRVVTTGCNWSLYYANGVYCAAAKHLSLIYWNEVKQEWQAEQMFTYLESKDGFKSYEVKIKLDPCPDYRYTGFIFVPFEKGVKLIEQYVELDTNLQPTSWYHTEGFPDYIDVDMLGFNSDPLYRKVRVRFSNRVSDPGEGSRIVLRDFNPTIPVYIEDGKICDEIKHYVLPTAFKYNYWSGSSFDEGGFIVIEPQGQNAFGGFAYGTSNYMIDQHNFTYSNILL